MSDTPQAPAPRLHGFRLRRSAAAGVYRVWVLTALVAAGAAAVTLLVRDLPALGAPVEVPWLVLVAMVYVAELTVVHLRFRRDAHSFSMSEIPLVVGLFVVSPIALIAAQLAGNAIALTVNRRQPLLKLVFNLSQFTLVTAIAVIAFRAVASLGEPMSPAAWAGALLASLTAMVVANVLINGAIRMSGGSLDRTEMLEVLGLSALAAAMNTGLGLVGVTILWTAPRTAWMALVPPFVLFFAYRAYISQRQQRSRLESLYEATRQLHGSPQIESALEAAVGHACNMFQAERAEVALILEGTEHPVYRTVRSASNQGVVMEPANGGSHWLGSVLHAVDGPTFLEGSLAAGFTATTVSTDAMTAPLAAGGSVGFILVSGRLGDVGRFERHDLKLLETLASQVGVSLENGQLEDSLAQLTELKEELRHQALHDSLTKLANRRLFSQRIEQALAESRDAAGTLAVLFLDLDDFKTVNDSLGHAAGDQLLIAAGERLRQSCRPRDSIARLGGDEFAVLLEGLDSPEAATEVAARIIDGLAAPFHIDGKVVASHASVGIAFGSAFQTPDQLLRNADAAMYAAKHGGKGTFRVFEPAMHTEMIQRLELKTDLKHAVETEQLTLAYQPIVSLGTGGICGVEALVRWHHPERGDVPPTQFIPLAEESGLIVEVGRWALREACRWGRRWQDQSEEPFTVSVNLSPRQLQAPGLVDDVSAALREFGIQPGTVVLEITENVLMQTAARKLAELKQLGVGLAIDDFGTGYSSLSYLDRFPIDVIKIDRSFVQRLGSGPDGSPLMRAVVQIGDSLGLQTIVEGIENEAQLDRLRDLGCRFGQGYFFAEPMEGSAIGALLDGPARGPQWNALWCEPPRLRAVE